jgi:hypothetical protein
MDLKKFLPNKEKDDFEYFWALVIEPSWIQAGIWRIQGQSAQVVTLSPASHWEAEEDLVNAADTALSAAIQDFPEDYEEPSKTVFGVVSSWVTNGEIKPEYLEKIKVLCKELSLTPVGFVVLSEAISHFYKSDEGTPLNAIALGVFKDEIEVSLFKLGNLIGTTMVARSLSIADDVTEGLTRLNQKDSVPSRFVVYDGKEGELEEVRQTLIKVDWNDYEGINFLHTPKVELVDPKTKIYAVSLAGASELADVTAVERLVGAEEETAEEASSGEDEGETVEDVGFVMEEDIAERTSEDGGKQEPKEFNESEAEVEDIEASKKELENVVPVEGEPTKKTLFGISPFSFIVNIKEKLPLLKLPKLKVPSTGKRIFFFGGMLFLLLIVGGFLLWWYVPKATVTIYVSPQRLDERMEIKVDPSADSANLEGRVIPGSNSQVSVSGEKTISTTGTKTVGEKAKGEVTIYRVGSQLEIESGTILTGPESLKFTLDDDVTVASGSAGSPGTTKTAVTAEDIGAEYNLASGTTFRVGNYSSSDMEAKNEDSFSGGSSRDISAVSQDDVDNLFDDLEKELLQKVKEEMKSNISENEMLIDDSIKSQVKTENYSNDVGEEATTLKLDLALDVSGVSVDEGSFLEFVREVLKDEIPDGFVLREKQAKVDFQFKEEKDGVLVFNARVEANLLPELDPDDISEKLVGKYPKLAEEYLIREVPGFVRAEIRRQPALPGRLGTLPRVAKNIEVEISAER